MKLMTSPPPARLSFPLTRYTVYMDMTVYTMEISVLCQAYCQKFTVMSVPLNSMVNAHI